MKTFPLKEPRNIISFCVFSFKGKAAAFWFLPVRLNPLIFISLT